MTKHEFNKGRSDWFLNKCPYCHETSIEITDTRNEVDPDTGDIACVDYTCHLCHGIWTVTYEPSRYYTYTLDGDFIDESKPVTDLRVPRGEVVKKDTVTVELPRSQFDAVVGTLEKMLKMVDSMQILDDPRFNEIARALSTMSQVDTSAKKSDTAENVKKNSPSRTRDLPPGYTFHSNTIMAQWVTVNSGDTDYVWSCRVITPDGSTLHFNTSVSEEEAFRGAIDKAQQHFLMSKLSVVGRLKEFKKRCDEGRMLQNDFCEALSILLAERLKE